MAAAEAVVLMTATVAAVVSVLDSGQQAMESVCRWVGRVLA